MSASTARPGRPRRYDVQPLMGFANKGAAYAAAMLDELTERLYDLISDLPQGALDFVPPGTTNSIAMLVLHMAWAEASWIARVTETSVPPELEECLSLGRQDGSGDLPPSSNSAEHLMGYCQRVRQELTKPALAPIENIDLEVSDPHRPMTVRGVLMHLIWHWTYHSGQVGLLRRMWGEQHYRWTFDQRVGDPRPV